MIEEILYVGRENALSPEYLAAVLDIGTVRAVRKQVERERREGAVILSSTIPPGGYYLPGSRQEVVRFIRTLENRAGSTLEALNSAREYLQKVPEQSKEDTGGSMKSMGEKIATTSAPISCRNF